MLDYLYKKSNYLILILIAIVGIAIPILQYFRIGVFYILLLTEVSLIAVAVRDFLSNFQENAKDASIKMTEEKVNHIDNELIKENSEMKKTQQILEDKQKIIAEFLRQGVIKEEDIIQDIGQESFIILHHFNRRPPVKYLMLLPEGRTPIKVLIKRLGFVPVGASHGSYFFHIINIKLLPKELRQVSSLEAYIRRKVLDGWKVAETRLADDDKEEHAKFMEAYYDKFNLIYLIGRVFSSELRIGHLNYPSFSKEFLPYLSSFTKKMHNVDKKKLNDIISLASISFFINSIEPIKRRKILDKETYIKKKFGITSLLEYESIPKDKWIEVFSNFLEKGDAEKCADEIYSSIKRDLPIIKTFL